MNPDAMVTKLLGELHEITGAGIVLLTASGEPVARYGLPDPSDMETAPAFLKSGEMRAEADGRIYRRVPLTDGSGAVLVAYGENAEMASRIALSEIRVISQGMKAGSDRTEVLRECLLGGLTGSKMQEKLRRFHIRDDVRRAVFLISVPAEEMNEAADALTAYCTESGGADYVVPMGDGVIALIKEAGREGAPADSGSSREETALLEEAEGFLAVLTEESMIDACAAYGHAAPRFDKINEAYEEAKTALEVGRVFYPERKIIYYGNLGIGRLICQLPVDLCRLFLEETFDHDVFADMDAETLRTVQDFFDNNLNVSETARGMYIHRNTLVYRLEKLERSTGLDIRRFEDAMTFKIAMMVELYVNSKRL